MKNTGYALNGVPIYSDSEVPRKTLYMINGKFRRKLTRGQVKAYEKLSGFETTGDVIYEQSSDEVQELLGSLMVPVPHRRTGKLTNVD